MIMNVILQVILFLPWVIFGASFLSITWGLVRLLENKDTAAVISSPIPGLRPMSLRAGFILWACQLFIFACGFTAFGAEYYFSHHPVL